MADAGSGQPFEAFFEDEMPRLVRGLYLLTGSWAEAEDLAQEAMARVFERWDRVGSMTSPAGYVYRTALNLNRRRLRRLRAHARRLIDHGYDLGGTESLQEDPTKGVELRTDLMRVLRGLPRRQREAIILVEWFDLPSSEAARLLGIKPVSLRVSVHRAKSAIRNALESVDHEDS